MTLSVCLTLDDRADAQVRALWQRLEESGVTTLATHTHGHHLPHLTLASLRSWDLDRVRVVLRPFADQSDRVLDLDAFGTFRRSRCWLAPAPTRGLLALQESVVDAVRRTEADLHQHYEPGSWIPHLTLAPRLHLPDLPVVAGLVYDVLPLHATVDRLLLVDTRTGERYPVVS